MNKKIYFGLIVVIGVLAVLGVFLLTENREEPSKEGCPEGHKPFTNLNHRQPICLPLCEEGVEYPPSPPDIAPQCLCPEGHMEKWRQVQGEKYNYSVWSCAVDTALSIDDWDWDIGQNCNGLTRPEQCKGLEWPVSYGCRKADIYNCYECLAEKNDEPGICEDIISDEKEVEDFLHDNCYWRLVVKFENENRREGIDFCEKFVEQGHKKACYDVIA